MELSAIKSALDELAADVAEVRPGECLACYLDRTLPKFGCRDHVLTARWNTAQSRPVPGLLSKLKARGGYCDCEVLLNVLDTGDPRGLRELLACAAAFSSLDAPDEEAW